MLNPRNKDSTQIRNQIIDETLRDMIDFQDLTPREREVIRRVFPFWSWIKGSSKVGARATYEHPLRVYAIGQTGELGLQAQEEQFGELPSFLKGAAILPDFLQNEQGTRTLNTGAMNPWLTPVDAATLVASMVPFGTQRLPFGSENPVAMASPFVKAPIEAFTGRDVFFGTPIDQRSNLFMTMAQRATSTPLTNLLGHPLKIGQQVQPGQPPAWMGKLYRPQSPRATTVASPWAELTGYVFPKPSELRMGPVRARAVEERRQELGL